MYLRQIVICSFSMTFGWLLTGKDPKVENETDPDPQHSNI